MNKPFLIPDPHRRHTPLNLTWEDLETALNVLAVPERLKDITDTIEACKALPMSRDIGRAITIVSAIAWLTDEHGPNDADDGAGASRFSREG